RIELPASVGIDRVGNDRDNELDLRAGNPLVQHLELHALPRVAQIIAQHLVRRPVAAGRIRAGELELDGNASRQVGRRGSACRGEEPPDLLLLNAAGLLHYLVRAGDRTQVGQTIDVDRKVVGDELDLGTSWRLRVGTARG